MSAGKVVGQTGQKEKWDRPEVILYGRTYF
jgi:hypothetical protein